MTEPIENQPIAPTPGFHPVEKPTLTPAQPVATTPGFHQAPRPVVEEPDPRPDKNDFQRVETADPAVSDKPKHRAESSEKKKFFPSAIQDKLHNYTQKSKDALEKGRAQVKDAKNKLAEAKEKAKAEAPAAPATSIGSLVSKLSDQVHKLIVCEIELAKVKGQEMAKRAGIGIAMLLLAAVLALYMLGFLFGAIASALALVLPTWAAKLIVAGIILLLVLIFALVGKSSLTKSKNSVPAPQEGVKDSIEAVKKGL